MPPFRAHLDVLCHYHDDYVSDSVEPLCGVGNEEGTMLWKVNGRRGAFCLRRWAKNALTLDQLQFMHAVLWHAEQEGFDRFPLPVETLEGMSYVAENGNFWQLEPWMEGKPMLNGRHAESKIISAMVSLAEFHNAAAKFPLPQAEGISPLLLSHEKTILEWDESRLDMLERRIRVQGLPPLVPRQRVFFVSDLSDSAGLETNAARPIGNSVTISYEAHTLTPSTLEVRLATTALHILAAIRRRRKSVLSQIVRCSNYSLPLVPCIYDFRLKNLFFSKKYFKGFLDFGAIGIDTPAVDVARLLENLTENYSISWVLGLSAYQSVRRLSAEELDALNVSRRSYTMTSALRWLNYMFVQNNPVKCSMRLYRRLEQLVERMENI
ncbi:MAG: phosphotransferase [Planctomycetia bacterium]|nr:phosphotransferase [Planctomycetia bacterium]